PAVVSLSDTFAVVAVAPAIGALKPTSTSARQGSTSVASLPGEVSAALLERLRTSVGKVIGLSGAWMPRPRLSLTHRATVNVRSLLAGSANDGWMTIAGPRPFQPMPPRDGNWLPDG